MIGSLRHAAVAAVRVIEARVRTSPLALRASRQVLAALAKISPEVRAYVRIRMMRLV